MTVDVGSWGYASEMVQAGEPYRCMECNLSLFGHGRAYCWACGVRLAEVHIQVIYQDPVVPGVSFFEACSEQCAMLYLSEKLHIGASGQQEEQRNG